MLAYLDALVTRGNFAQYFTPDIVVSLVGESQEAQGAEAAEQFIRAVHEQAFDATPEVKTLTVEESKAAIEADFVGRHTGEFLGRAATGNEVRVPYSVHYDLENGRIKALRIYGILPGLIKQIEP
jgi:predicted ester cyclase